mgnify:CR=1 FL=1
MKERARRNTLRKVDLVMWTKNGERTLRTVLSRIDQVIPEDSVNQRIIIDDGSTDRTRDIARSFGWAVIDNKGHGIPDAANTALSHVVTERFISFEQDLLLDRKWWDNVPPLLDDPKAVVASGVRVPDRPSGLRITHEYILERQISKMSDQTQYSSVGKTSDNTIYRTGFVRQIGGFPKLRFREGIDVFVARRVFEMGLIWRVSFGTKSFHLRQGLTQELMHHYWYGGCRRELHRLMGSDVYANFPKAVLISLKSPLVGLHGAFVKSCPQILYIYPLMRLFALIGEIRPYLYGGKP